MGNPAPCVHYAWIPSNTRPFERIQRPWRSYKDTLHLHLSTKTARQDLTDDIVSGGTTRRTRVERKDTETAQQSLQHRVIACVIVFAFNLDALSKRTYTVRLLLHSGAVLFDSLARYLRSHFSPYSLCSLAIHFHVVVVRLARVFHVVSMLEDVSDASMAAVYSSLSRA